MSSHIDTISLHAGQSPDSIRAHALFPSPNHQPCFKNTEHAYQFIWIKEFGNIYKNNEPNHRCVRTTGGGN